MLRPSGATPLDIRRIQQKPLSSGRSIALIFGGGCRGYSDPSEVVCQLPWYVFPRVRCAAPPDKKHAAQAHLIPGIPFCLATHEPTTFKLLWVPILGYDSILLVLFLYKGIESHIITYHNRLAPTTLLDMIYKHSLTNFLA